MGVNSLPKTVTRQRRGCNLNPGPSAPESTRLPSHDCDTNYVCVSEHCVGLFSSRNMKYRLDRQKSATLEEPTLADMTEKAIRILRRGSKGYFLLVEG